MFTINCPKTVMVLSPLAIVIGDDHPVFRSGRSYNDLFVVGFHYGSTDVCYQQTNCVVCHSETILQTFRAVPCSHIMESDGHLQSWVQRLAVIGVLLANDWCQPLYHLLKHCRFAPDKGLKSGRILNRQFYYQMFKLTKCWSSQQQWFTPPPSLPPLPPLSDELLMLMLDCNIILLII